MNWQKLHTALTPEERDQRTQLILERIELRREQLLQERIESLKQAKGRTLRERRQILNWARFIGMRPSMSRATRKLYRALFLFILGTGSSTVWLMGLVVPHTIGTLLVFGYDLVLVMILLIKPFDRRKQLLSHSWNTPNRKVTGSSI